MCPSRYLFYNFEVEDDSSVIGVDEAVKYNFVVNISEYLSICRARSMYTQLLFQKNI